MQSATGHLTNGSTAQQHLLQQLHHPVFTGCRSLIHLDVLPLTVSMSQARMIVHSVSISLMRSRQTMMAEMIRSDPLFMVILINFIWLFLTAGGKKYLKPAMLQKDGMAHFKEKNRTATLLYGTQNIT